MMILIAITVIAFIQPPVYKTLTGMGKDKRGERSHAPSLISLMVSVIVKPCLLYFKGHALLGRIIQQNSQNNLDQKKKEAYTVSSQ